MTTNPVDPATLNAATGRPRVVMADDHSLLLEALAGVLQPEFDIVAKVGDGLALIEAVASLAPEVAVLDVGMPKLDGMAAAGQLRAQSPKTRLIFLTMHTDSALAAQALRLGASAYVHKSAAAAELTHAIREALADRRYLSPGIHDGGIDQLLADLPEPETEQRMTPRETEVVRLLAKGLSMKEVARALAITPRTVAFHKYNIMKTFALTSNADLFQHALKHGLIEP
jgi:DNA-binding NarL/FixJ family response regulator